MSEQFPEGVIPARTPIKHTTVVVEKLNLPDGKPAPIVETVKTTTYNAPIPPEAQ